jgi:hypothetical protein
MESNKWGDTQGMSAPKKYTYIPILNTVSLKFFWGTLNLLYEVWR